jgi:AraC-like DNA-binding protein
VQYIVRVEREFVEQIIATELQDRLRTPLVFRPVSRDTGISAWLHQILSTPALPAADPETSRSVLGDRRVVRSLERTLMLMFLTSFEHSETQALNRPRLGSAPYYIRRAEEYIRANAREDLTVESIAAAARVSTRSIYYGFKRWRDTTPMAHVRKVRLDLARAALLRAGREGGTVSQAAVAVGFTNFSQFSKVYKARFGETPSATLRLA